ncbi:PREDICTED: uncharacterized protein LOC104707791 [Camelina sativa]|uniref:Uncharacterized protein LOC104707791 n=1 Tax=Camelina sativa TaxID=90675 RepID=A0ABM0T8J9_CAMSA|nr:PREDICTED: uncharacterized protein LOC104707791 [Camelina sativa]
MMDSVISEDDGCKDVPMFTGTGLSVWIPKVERLFSRGRYSDDAKLDLVFLYLDGVALTWFMREMSKEKIMDWNVFKQRLLAQFDPVKNCSSQVPSATDLISNCESEVESTCPVKICSSSEAILATKALGGGEYFVTDSSIVEIHSSSQKESDHVSPPIEDIQVSISNLEPSLSLCSEPLNVFEAWPFDTVWRNREHPQPGFECVKNKKNAHKVFDGLFPISHRLQQKKKLSLSPKSWKFKFKNMTMLRTRSQRDHNIDLVKKKRTFRNLRLNKQAHMSRVTSRMRMMHDPGGVKQLLHGDTELIFFPDKESRGNYRDIAVKPRLQVSLDDIELQQLEDVNIALISHMSQLHCSLGFTLEKKFVTWFHVVCVLSNIRFMLVRLQEKSSNAWKFPSNYGSEGLQ